MKNMKVEQINIISYFIWSLKEKISSEITSALTFFTEYSYSFYLGEALKFHLLLSKIGKSPIA